MLIAIVALAAAPQALHDAQRLVNAAQERATDHFWSVFLSYQTPGAENRVAPQLVADNRTDEACQLERIVAGAARDASALRRGANSVQPKSLQAAERTSEKAESLVSEAVAPDFSDKELEGLEEASRALTGARERALARAAGLHSGDTGRALDAASKTTMSYSYVQTGESMKKVRQAMEMDKLMRQRARYPMDVAEPGNPPATPNPIGSM